MESLGKYMRRLGRESKDKALVKSRVQNIKKLILSIREKQWEILTAQDDADLFEAQKLLDKILTRYPY